MLIPVCYNGKEIQMISSRRSSIGQYTKRSDLFGRLQMSPRRLCIKIVNNND